MLFVTAGFGALMAAEREQKLRSQHEHNHTIRKNVVHIVTDVKEKHSPKLTDVKEKHSPKFPTRQAATTRKISPKLSKDSEAVLKDNNSPAVHKRLKQKVCVTCIYLYIYIYIYIYIYSLEHLF